MGEAKRKAEKRRSDFPHEEHQAIAHAVHSGVFFLLDGTHRRLHSDKAGEGGPIFQGGLSALLEFICQTQYTDAQIKAAFAQQIDLLLPQIRQAIALDNTKGSA